MVFHVFDIYIRCNFNMKPEQNEFLRSRKNEGLKSSVLPVVAIISNSDAWKVQSISVLFDDFLQPSAVSLLVQVSRSKRPKSDGKCQFSTELLITYLGTLCSALLTKNKLNLFKAPFKLHCKYLQFFIVSSFHCNLVVRFTLIT